MPKRDDPQEARKRELRLRARAQHRRHSYLPGHSVHYIQARLAAAELSTSPVGTVQHIDERGIVVLIEGEQRRYRCSERAKAKELAEADPTVRIQEARGLIWFGLRPISVARVR